MAGVGQRLRQRLFGSEEPLPDGQQEEEAGPDLSEDNRSAAEDMPDDVVTVDEMFTYPERDEYFWRLDV